MPETNNVDFTLSFSNSPYSVELCDDVVTVKKNDTVVDIYFDEDEVTLSVEQDSEEIENITVSLEKHVDESELPQVSTPVTTNNSDLEQLVKNEKFKQLISQVKPAKAVEAEKLVDTEKNDLQALIEQEVSKVTTTILEKLNNKN